MSYPNNSRRQTPGEGSSGGHGRSRTHVPYAPLSQPQTNDYLNYPTTNPASYLGAYPAVDSEPWPHTAPEYAWVNGASATLSGGRSAAEYPPYPLPSAVTNDDLPQPYPGLYPGPYTYMNTNEPWPNVFSGQNVAPSPPSATVNPQVLHQAPPTQSTSTRTRRQPSPQTPQIASSSAVDPNPPTYRIVRREGRDALECLCGCRRSYGRHNEWARAHGYTETSCEICGCSQSRPDSLRRHMRPRHGIDLTERAR
ncbi:hypothetical protein RSAG8_00396, partial [Rhizoctonia solani AG-8 WAC10335]